MFSFKHKLVVYFLLLALLPLAAAYAGFRSVSQRSETRLVDARLHAALRATLAAYDDELDRVAAQADRFAERPAFQRALADDDRAALQRLVSTRPGLRVEAHGRVLAGVRPKLAAERRVTIISVPGAREVGVVVAAVPLDGALVSTLRRRSGLGPDEHVLLVSRGDVVASSGRFQGRLSAPHGETATVSLGEERYRTLASEPSGPDSTSIAVVSPQAGIDAAQASAGRGLLAVLCVTLVLVLVVAYLLGRSIVGTIGGLVDAARAIAGGRLHRRVPVRGRDELALLGRSFNDMAEQLEGRLADLEAERHRHRELTLRFGEALAATHDTDQLLKAVVETVAEATSATSAELRAAGTRTYRVGAAEDGPEQLELPLIAGRESFGWLVLTGTRFRGEERETAALLVAQAVIALENARLQRILERQALLDDLTGLANRRQAERVLDAELTRAERFSSTLAVVITDLDDFKAVNDAHGHQAGDAVLQEFARVLTDGLREFDLAARWGGEEFVVVLPGSDLDGAHQVAERLRATLAARPIVAPSGTVLHVTASFGIADHPTEPTRERLLASADTALYEAKRLGKNCVARAHSSTPAGLADAGAR